MTPRAQRMISCLAFAAAFGERHGWKASWISLCGVLYLLGEKVL